MKNDDRMVYYGFIYSENEISYLQNLCDSIEWERVDDSSEENVTNGNRFIGTPEKYLDPDKLIQTYLNHLPELVSSCLNDGFILSGGYTPDVKISRYEAGDLYGWHCDCWESHEITKHWRREISSVTYLNDDYEGGETIFDSGLVIKPQTGKTLIFPSNWCFPHQGNPVKSGTKYIYVKHIWL